jgi:hypothetical protein
MIRRHQYMRLPILSLILLVGAANTVVAAEGARSASGQGGAPQSSRSAAIPSVKALAAELPCTVEFFDVEGCPAFLLRPTGKPASPPMPWVWYAPVIGNPNGDHAWMLRQWLAKGIGMAGVDVGESYGSPRGRRIYTALWETLTSRYAMSKRACLLPQSRGGLMLYNWAVENPSRVACIAGIYTVCDLRSYPGLDRACGAYNMRAADLQTHLAQHNPIDRLAALAKAAVPILHVHGDADTVVPLEKNSGELQRRYRALGGPMRLIVVPGKGHQVCSPFFQCQELVDFVAAAASRANACHDSVVARRSLPRETALAQSGSAAAVILVPDEPAYRELGQTLAAAIAEKTGVRLAVENTVDYVARQPRAVKPERLERHFIVLGQFWNNAVLERLYAGYFDPTDALFPGPGGWELRSVCSPFRVGQNCVVVTGSDLEGCRKAVAALPALIEGTGPQSRMPFLHRVHLNGEAAQLEASYRQHMAPILAELDRYAVFGHPQGKVWADQNPNDFLTWNDRNLASAAVFGLRFWATGDRRDAEAFKRLVSGCRAHVDRLAQSYR